jgi:DNA-binding PadR family transcriptional regulator
MDVDAFLESVSTDGLRLPATDAATTLQRAPEKVDALFHLPLIAMAIMIIARQNPFKTMVMGRSVALLLIEHFTALQRSAHGLEMSLTLRRRCADALAFLEAAGLAIVSQDGRRIVTLTAAGKTHLDRSAHDGTDLGLFVRQLRTHHERVKARFGDER